MKIVSIVCLSLSFVLMLGCTTLNSYTGTWVVPAKPQVVSIQWGTMTEGTNIFYFLTKDQAIQLVNNIDEMKAYTEKMELLVKTMTKFYDTKLEEYKKLEK